MSASYDEGVRAGRRSFRLSVLVDGKLTVKRVELPMLTVLTEPGLTIDLGRGVRLLLEDSLPDFETYQDLDG